VPRGRYLWLCNGSASHAVLRAVGTFRMHVVTVQRAWRERLARYECMLLVLDRCVCVCVCVIVNHRPAHLMRPAPPPAQPVLTVASIGGGPHRCHK
jgi:hypothetical protein